MTIKYAFSRPTTSDEERNLLFNDYQKAGYVGLQLNGGLYAPYLLQPERYM